MYYLCRCFSRTFSDRFPSKRVNQFPHECVLTIKDFLCVVCRRCGGDGGGDDDSGGRRRLHPLETEPRWLPTTYNLKTELPQFVSYFQRRQKG